MQAIQIFSQFMKKSKSLIYLTLFLEIEGKKKIS